MSALTQYNVKVKDRVSSRVERERPWACVVKRRQ